LGRRVQHSAEIDKKVDERTDQRFSTGSPLNSIQALPLAVDFLQHDQPMGLASAMRLSGEQEILSVWALDEKSSSDHIDILSQAVAGNGFGERLIGTVGSFMMMLSRRTISVPPACWGRFLW
jgi:hypothetical protein